MKIKDAAKLLGLADQTLRIFLQHGKFPEFAIAVKTSSRWTYYIEEFKLRSYISTNQIQASYLMRSPDSNRPKYNAQ